MTLLFALMQYHVLLKIDQSSINRTQSVLLCIRLLTVLPYKREDLAHFRPFGKGELPEEDSVFKLEDLHAGQFTLIFVEALTSVSVICSGSSKIASR